MLNRTEKLIAKLLATTVLASAAPALAQDADQSTDEIVVTGRYIPNEKRITSEISSTMDTESFEKTGAGDIASALTRVTGLTLSKGKFVVVRGLNERYSFATLNGSPLPSPEPLRRVAPLDLFPTSILKNVVVQKTYSPEFSAEFGGGMIDMRTKTIPDEGFLDISFSGGYNTETTGKEGLYYEGSDTDWLGIDDGLRDIPPLGTDGNVAAGQNFETHRTLLMNRMDEVPGDAGGRVSAGNRYGLGNGMSLGILATLGYDNEWTTRVGESNTARLDAGVLGLFNDQVKTSTENKISLNGMLTLGLDLNDNNEVQANGFFTRLSSAEARSIIGTDNEDRLLRQDFTEWFEREVYMGQLTGKHYFPGMSNAELSWRASYAEAARYAPYERRVNYEDYEDGLGYRFQFNRPGTNNSIRFSNLDDVTTDFGADLVVPTEFAGKAVDFKLGGMYLDKQRDSRQADFRYFGSLPEELRLSRIDLIFSDAVVDAGILEIRRGGTTGFPDVSNAGLEIYGAYAGVDAEINDRLRFALGVRYEESEQTTAIEQSTVANSQFNFDPLKTDYFLPAATLTWTFNDNMQLRLAASQTINRPQFRELTPSIFVNTDTDNRFVGNPFLVNSESNNLDARFEWYFGPEQFFTIGGFYKEFTNPIEEFIFNGLGDSNATSFLNAKSAELMGVEVEFEKNFAFTDLPLFNGEAFATKDLVFRSNYTFTESSVSASGNVAIVPPSVNPSQGITPLILPAAGLYTDGRAMQGQSDHIANLQLGIEDYERNYEATVLFNYASERIRAVEDRANGLPSIIEQLPITVDFVFNWDMVAWGGDYSLGFKVRNILGDKYVASQSLDGNTVIVESYKPGTAISASLKRSF